MEHKKRRPKILSWRVVLMTTGGRQINFDIDNSDATEIIDELIENEYPVTWKAR